MVKGISRQVIVVDSPDKKLFDQAIFILRDDAVGERAVTDEDLLKEARCLMHSGRSRKRYYRVAWASVGAAAVTLAWVLSSLL